MLYKYEFASSPILNYNFGPQKVGRLFINYVATRLTWKRN